MIGVFDSGAGGITVMRELRAISPSCDLVFFPDRKNAPYGIKSEKELVRLVERDIELLISHGADEVLMACCTASTVHQLINKSLRKRSIPIIKPTAKAAARATASGRVGVIATEATVRSGAFSKELSALGIHEVTELASGRLVDIIERGARDGSLAEKDARWLSAHLAPLREHGIDTLILGCTHFPHLWGEISARLPEVKIISSSREAAIEAVKNTRPTGNGKTVYIASK